MENKKEKLTEYALETALDELYEAKERIKELEEQLNIVKDPIHDEIYQKMIPFINKMNELKAECAQLESNGLDELESDLIKQYPDYKQFIEDVIYFDYKRRF